MSRGFRPSTAATKPQVKGMIHGHDPPPSRSLQTGSRNRCGLRVPSTDRYALRSTDRSQRRAHAIVLLILGREVRRKLWSKGVRGAAVARPASDG